MSTILLKFCVYDLDINDLKLAYFQLTFQTDSVAELQTYRYSKYSAIYLICLTLD